MLSRASGCVKPVGNVGKGRTLRLLTPNMVILVSAIKSNKRFGELQATMFEVNDCMIS